MWWHWSAGKTVLVCAKLTKKNVLVISRGIGTGQKVGEGGQIHIWEWQFTGMDNYGRSLHDAIDIS